MLYHLEALVTVASSEWAAALVLSAPLVQVVKVVAVFPVYDIFSEPIVTVPTDSNPVVLSTVRVVTLSFIPPLRSVLELVLS